MATTNAVVKPKTTHKVVEGDTVLSVANANGLSVGRLMKLNDLDSNVLRVGKTLKLK